MRPARPVAPSAGLLPSSPCSRPLLLTSPGLSPTLRRLSLPAFPSHNSLEPVVAAILRSLCSGARLSVTSRRAGPPSLAVTGTGRSQRVHTGRKLWDSRGNGLPSLMRASVREKGIWLAEEFKIQ